MSETTVDATDQGGKDGGTTPPADDAKTITMTSVQLAERLERAKPKDYDDLKAKAAEFDKLADANKSEIEKANDRVTKAEAEAARVPSLVADALRTHLVARNGIDKEDAELFLTANDPELLLKQVDRLLAQGSQRKTNHVTREGANPSANERADAAFARQLLAGD